VLKWPQRVADICGVTSVLTDLGLIPPARLGPFVEMARKQIGLSREALAAASNGRLSVRDLSLLESGRLICRETQLSAIQELLGVPFASVVPLRARLIIDPMQGRMVLGGRIAEVVPNAPDSELLVRYLALVYLCRRARPGSFIVPRADDLDVLGELLNQPTQVIRQQLAQLCFHERDVLRVAVRSASQRRSIPGLGLLVGIHRRGALVLVDPETPPSELRTETADDEECEASIVQIAPARQRKRMLTPPERQ
jgi:Helix-turn-helix domain